MFREKVTFYIHLKSNVPRHFTQLKKWKRRCEVFSLGDQASGDTTAPVQSVPSIAQHLHIGYDFGQIRKGAHLGGSNLAEGRGQ